MLRYQKSQPHCLFPFQSFEDSNLLRLKSLKGQCDVNYRGILNSGLLFNIVRHGTEQMLASPIDRFHRHATKKTIQWIQSRYCDFIGNKERRHFSKFQICAFSQTLDIRRKVSQKFTEASMETPYWCTSVVHQYGGRKIVLTSGTYFGYRGG